MANNATFTFSVPEDTDSDYLQIHSCTTKDGSYSQVGSNIAYDYGETTYEFEDINTVIYYKVRFYNSVDDQYSPYSEPIYGGDWSNNTKPFLAVSTTTDGANYASIQDVRDFSGLTADDVSNDRVSQSLRRARAIVDIKTADMGMDRFASFESDIQRRKYNASLRIVKEAEINYSLGMIYRGMVDDIIMEGIRGDASPASFSIGSTSVNLQSASKDSNSYRQLERLSTMYTSRATVLLAMIQPSSINISFNEFGFRKYPKFLWPESIRGKY